MVYKATQDVVVRVRPLLDRLAARSVDKVRLLQYLSARAGEGWGVLELVADETSGAPDAATGAGHHADLAVEPPCHGAHSSGRIGHAPRAQETFVRVRDPYNDAP